MEYGGSPVEDFIGIASGCGLRAQPRHDIVPVIIALKKFGGAKMKITGFLSLVTPVAAQSVLVARGVAELDPSVRA